ncbi:hypothetical protein [Streptomyces sp. ITFR-16]|uniref:hypothetical protein n=1 Tax=Streptomyces sp. ITFR-16 TaxID=3075198 RepID=UPI002889BF10|nr:hypothetical protein [Streptomyces sp. ITFR-16]WNI27170.1 hypothetical protein RLT58_35080 [Streptomyces sp. ITFR-16]
MENPTRKAAAAGAATLLAVGLVVTGANVAAASDSATTRITSSAQLKAGILLAAAHDRESGAEPLSQSVGGRVAGIDTQSSTC